ncbi:MAG: NusG domain II-containing protein [Acutalibacteraceae bacterium]|jgi:hypothetical protein
MGKNKVSGKFRNDLLLVLAVVLAAAAILAVYKLNSRKGTTVRVLIDGKTKYTFSLSEQVEKKISTKYGENIISIKDGRVSVKSADCPDKICVKHRAISKNGETIVCLPHKLVVEVSDEG